MPEEFFFYGNPTHHRVGLAQDGWITWKQRQSCLRRSFIEERFTAKAFGESMELMIGVEFAAELFLFSSFLCGSLLLILCLVREDGRMMNERVKDDWMWGGWRE